MSTFWKPTQQPELYHYGVKGMKWKNKKASTEAQEAMTGIGSGVVDYNGEVNSFRNGYATMYFNAKAGINHEKNRPEWQKKWKRSDARKTLKGLLSKIKGKKESSHGDRPRSRKRNVTGGGKGVKLRGSATK